LDSVRIQQPASTRAGWLIGDREEHRHHNVPISFDSVQRVAQEIHSGATTRCGFHLE